MQELMKKEREDLPNQIYDVVMNKLGDDIRDIIFEYLSKTSKDEILLPISIFKTILPPLEAVVKYLKENLGMRFTEIADRLHRDDRTIWVTYRNSLSKYVEFEIDYTLQIPLSILADRSLSVLEHVSRYLKDNMGYSNKKIATILDKDESTIWTVYHRAQIKVKMVN